MVNLTQLVLYQEDPIYNINRFVLQESCMERNLKTDAKFSACRKYRYALWRNWDESKPYAMIIGLNPSTADENKNDPTITRCINFATSWGYGGVCVTNLFAYCATVPSDMKASNDPIGTRMMHGFIN